ncbi:MAG: HNH endonuclease [Rhodobacteraceae bacterium]|nr:HNH endonuclease [Paracoccaceae bacterium]
MADIFIKPILWNTNGYQTPSGFKASAGFPKEFGFGHEEWNNSTQMEFDEDGVKYRAFHTEGLGKAQPSAAEAFVFLIASHDGVQELVGVAGNATSLHSNDDIGIRASLVNRLGIESFRDQAWEQTIVKNCFNGDLTKFNKKWAEDVNWIPNWTCPSEMYLWLAEPVSLDSQEITGKDRLITMYSSYAGIDATQAITILNQIPKEQRNSTWDRLWLAIEALKNGSEVRDIAEIENKDIPKTTKKALIDARRGQGGFRKELMGRWMQKCAVTGCGVREVLRASHIKAWRSCSDSQRLDSNNGLLLAAHLDALFDRGLISFSDNGSMLVANRISQKERRTLGLSISLREKLLEGERNYLAHHRKEYGFEA